MRAVLLAGLTAVAITAIGDPFSVSAQTPKEAPKGSEKDTPAAENTRTKLLKAKVTIASKDVPLGEILKECAAQVDMQGERPVMWSYSPSFPFSQKVTFTANEKPLDEVLDTLFKKAGGEIGYFVVSKEGDKYDGWVRLTTTGERGEAPPPPTAAQEAEAADKLTLAKKLIDSGKAASAKPVLDILVRKFTATKAGTEAIELLKAIEKDEK